MNRVGWGLVGLLLLLGLYLVSLYSYLLFHTLVEMFCIVVAAAIFVIVWNARRLLDSDYLLFLGISFLFVALLDSLHTLTYKGMGVFPGTEANVPTQLWIASRYLQGLAFLVAPAFLTRRIPARWTVAGGILFACLIVASVFIWPIFPDAYIEGQGLTPFKIASEYVISGMLLLGGFFLWQRRQALDPAVWRWLAAAILFNVGAELSFTFYLDVYDLSNLIGHFFKAISFYFIYKAVVETGLVRPYSLLFRELKRSEVGLREERDLISAILEVAGALVLVLDREGRIVRFNRACERITGYTADEVAGAPFWDLFLVAEETGPVKAVFTQLVAGQFPNRYENYWLTKQGERRLVAWSNTAILDEAGAVAYVVATGIDITEQRQAEAQLRARHDELDAFAHTVAHDLKNPLQLLVGYAELVEEAEVDNMAEDSAALLHAVVRTGVKMNNIIEELLLLAGVRRAAVEPRPLDMADLVTGARQRLADLIKEYEAEILVPDAWPLALGHGPWIEEVWTNYISNAVKYGGVPPRVELGAAEENGMVRFWVSDNGAGLDAKARSQLFRPFTQLSQVRAEGHGLGLSIVRRIVEKLGGEVGIEPSLPGRQGSVFYFMLPAVPAAMLKADQDESKI
jgi:PAS domain S-box-containing protein